ncbi:MAG TPA: alkaline phosphatase D family protein [Nocardioides sp.]|uniref:alkaline phosphatase D family protein n=1 Tax=Nocardioides sp. TaxID=35761 RepID=UPI002ED7FBAB
MKHFRHGVASGDPLPDAVVIWTRVTPTRAALPGSGKGPRVRVRWQVSTSPRFTRVVRRGTFATGAGRDHTVKLDVTGLQPATTYYYRFGYHRQWSRIGRTRTAPAPGSAPANLRFGVVSCANLQAGWFAAYRGLAARNDLDAVIHLGDYLYEYAPGQYGMGNADVDVRRHVPARETVTLADYRRRHAQYKQDRDLAALHARHPVIVTWDDHEVTNDAWAGGAENHDTGERSWARRRRHAHQAYDEWMPVRMSGTARLDGKQLYRRLAFGELAELTMLDLRTYRSQQVATPSPAVGDPGRTIAGREQLDWLKDGLSPDRPLWRLVGNPVMIAPVTFGALPQRLQAAVNQVTGIVPDGGAAYNTDQWDGYTADRRELFEHIADQGVRDVVFLTGDIHSAWACDLPLDPATYPVMGTTAGVEFVCASVTSNNLKDITNTPPRTSSVAVENVLKTANRHVKHLDFDSHGFSVLDLTPARAQMDWYVIGSRADRDTAITWSASWATDAGTGRVRRAKGPVA